MFLSPFDDRCTSTLPPPPFNYLAPNKDLHAGQKYTQFSCCSLSSLSPWSPECEFLVDSQIGASSALPELVVQPQLVKPDQKRREGDVGCRKDGPAQPGSDPLVIGVRQLSLDLVQDGFHVWEEGEKAGSGVEDVQDVGGRDCLHGGQKKMLFKTVTWKWEISRNLSFPFLEINTEDN